MSRPVTILATTTAIAVVVAVAAATAGGAVVTLRVESEGAPAPLFDGPVVTTPHAVDGGDGSGPHPCWGAPGAPPAATATGALDDALRGTALSWRGDWDPSFGDFFVDRIGEFASAAPADYWSLSVDGAFSAGGCHATVGDGDTILFRYGALFAPGAPQAPGASHTGGKPPAPGGGPASTGAAPSGRRPRPVALAAAAFLRRAAEPGESWARLALALRAGRGGAAATALVSPELRAQRADGSLGEDVNATALAVLALRESRPGAAGRAAGWLAARQGAGGGFGYRAGAPPDVDTTALAAWSLAAGGRRSAARRGAVFVRGAQEADGGFPAIPGAGSNAQSTGLGLAALRASGLGPRSAETPDGLTPLDYVTSLARRDGSIAYRPGMRPTPVWTTAQALLGLTVRAKLLGFQAGRSRG